MEFDLAPKNIVAICWKINRIGTHHSRSNSEKNIVFFLFIHPIILYRDINHISMTWKLKGAWGREEIETGERGSKGLENGQSK